MPGWILTLMQVVINQVWLESNVQGKIPWIWFKLEIFCKNEYYWDSYSLFDSFRRWLALTSHLAGRASQTTSETIPPPNPSSGVGLGFQLRTHQDCKKSWQEENCWWTIHMRTRSLQSLKQIISPKLLKAKNNQSDKMTADSCCCRQSNTVIAAQITKAVATLQLIFRPKSWRLSLRTCFCNGTTL